LNYVDLDVSSTSGVHKMKDVSVSYAEVILPASRKEKPNENDQPKKAASLKVCCIPVTHYILENF